MKNDENISDGQYSPWEFLQAMGNTIGSFKTTEVLIKSDSEQSEEEHLVNEDPESKCAVCLLGRTTTCVLIPCRHAVCCIICGELSEEKEKLVQSAVRS